jgi:hypothetical protein
MQYSTLTPDQHQAIVATLASMPTLAEGLGTTETACSMAAINLALTGRLTDATPACMSIGVGQWIILVQDACPPTIGRDHPRWRAALPLAAGTGRHVARELARANLLRDWMFDDCLSQLQGLADTGGYGVQWAAMLVERTEKACRAVMDACARTRYDDVVAAYAGDRAADAARIARLATQKVAAATASARASHYGGIADAINEAARASGKAAVAAIRAADAVFAAHSVAPHVVRDDPAAARAAEARAAEANADFWRRAAPCTMLEILANT